MQKILPKEPQGNFNVHLGPFKLTMIAAAVFDRRCNFQSIVFVFQEAKTVFATRAILKRESRASP